MVSTEGSRRRRPREVVAQSGAPLAVAAPGRTADPQALNELLHHRLRLGIISALAGSGVLTFVELRSVLETTDGNLSVHARKLEDAGYISCAKSFDRRRPRTEYRLEADGRRALERYLDHMQAVIEAARHTLES